MPAALLSILTGIFALATAILWLVIGWRAMRAHEELASQIALMREELRQRALAPASERKIL
jgi:hypothetical protein